MTLHPTRRLQDGRYILLGLLRTGGEAEVWRALDTVAGEQRALKVWLAADGGAEAAARELELARRVVHPHVVRVDDAFVDGDHAFVVMELAEGSLAERVATMGPLTPDEAFAALEGPLQALEAAHAAGIVHRDVKPHNLLVFGALDGALHGALTHAVPGDAGRPRAVVKLADFGIAQVRAEGLTRTRSGAFLGSLPFMSPEQRRDPRNVGPATDVYAAAVTLAWLVTGKAPGDLYLSETLEELRADLRGRGLEKREIERVVGVVEAGGRLEAGGRAGVGTRKAGPLRKATALRTPSWKWKSALWATAAGMCLTVVPFLRLGPLQPAAAENSVPDCTDRVTQWVEDVRMGPLETTSAAVADIDQDGRDDAVFTNQMAESATIWWGRSDGMPDVSLDIPIGRAYAPVSVGDVNNDGVADLVAALQDDSAFSVILGAGHRSFAMPERMFQSPPPSSIALVNVVGDPSPDILYNELFNNMMVRERAHAEWLPHRKLLGLDPATSMVGVIHGTSGTWLLLTERDRMALRALDGSAGRTIESLLRWIPAAAGAKEAYGLDTLGNIIRVRPAEENCVIGPYSAPWSPAAAGDLDGDGEIGRAHV